jgi:hypothetical protein
MQNPLAIGMNLLSQKNALTKAFGHVNITRDPDDKKGVIASVEGWYGPQDAQEHQKAKIFAGGKNHLEAIPALFEAAASMANNGIEIENGKTFEYDGRYTTRNKKGQEVTYHTGEDKRFPKGFYLDGQPFRTMR